MPIERSYALTSSRKCHNMRGAVFDALEGWNYQELFGVIPVLIPCPSNQQEPDTPIQLPARPRLRMQNKKRHTSGKDLGEKNLWRESAGAVEKNIGVWVCRF